MRQILTFVLILCLASCTESRQARTILHNAEMCMPNAPDSALALVRGISGQSLLTKKFRARHALLLSMAQDKCYFDVTEDSTIVVAYEYYRYHGSKHERLLASYYFGVIRENAKEYINAALAFHEAEPLAEELRDYRQLSLIEQHLSHIYALNYDHIRSLEYAEKAVCSAEQAGESFMADYCRYDVAVQLLSEYRYEDAESVLKQILDANDENTELFSFAAKKMAHVLLYGNNHDIIKAKEYYLRIKKNETSSLSSHDYGVLALISEKENESGKADFYLGLSERLLRTPLDSLMYFNDCRNVYDERKDWEKAHRAKTASARIQDRMTIELLGQSLTHAMENYYKSIWEIEKERSRSRLLFFFLIGTFMVIVSLTLYFLLRKKNQRTLEEMANIQDVSSDLVDTLIIDKVNLLKQLSESYFSWEDDAIVKRESKMGKLSKDEIITSFRAQLGKLRNDHSIIATLEQSLNLTDNGIMEKARQYLRNETELSFSVLTLLFSGFSIRSISFLLRMSEASLRMRKTRFKQRFQTLPDPDRSHFIEKLG